MGGVQPVGTAFGIKALLPSRAPKLSPGGCFGPGTPILTPDGSRPIQDIRPGDWVMAAPDDDPMADPVPPGRGGLRELPADAGPARKRPDDPHDGRTPILG